jgi:membrane protease YdiL (CAAX protease family)
LRLSHIFKGSRWFHSVYLSLASAIGEELLFRGALQPWLGIGFTSAAFALLHLDPERGLSIWTLWAFVGGLVLGYSYETTNCIWVPIAIHAAVNSIAIVRLSRFYDRVASNTRKSPVAPGPNHS